MNSHRQTELIPNRQFSCDDSFFFTNNLIKPEENSNIEKRTENIRNRTKLDNLRIIANK